MRVRLVAGLGVAVAVASATPATAAPVAVDVRTSNDSAVTITASTTLTVDYRLLRSVAPDRAYGVYVAGRGGRSGVVYVDGFDLADAADAPYRVPLWLTPDERGIPPESVDAGAFRRVLPAGTYTLYGVGGRAAVRVSAAGGVRVVRTVRTRPRRATATSVSAPITAGTVPPVWDAAAATVPPGARVVVAARQLRDVTMQSGPSALTACLARSGGPGCTSDDDGQVVYGRGRSWSTDSVHSVEIFVCVRYIDDLEDGVVAPARVVSVSAEPVRRVDAVAFTWEPPPGA